MYRIFVKEIANDHDFSKSQKHENADTLLKGNPFFWSMECRRKELERTLSEVGLEYEILSYLRELLLKILKDDEKSEDKTKVSEKEFEGTDTRLEILEAGIARVVSILEEAPMTERFKPVKSLLDNLSEVLQNFNSDMTEIQRIAQLEMAVGEALNYLQSSKLAKRFNLLKDIRKYLEEAIDKGNMV